MMSEACERAINRVARWRSVFAGRLLGMRADDDHELIAVKDIFEKLLLLRAEVNALIVALHAANVVPSETFQQHLIEECAHLELELERKFPGFKATDVGITIDTVTAVETMGRGWHP